MPKVFIIDVTNRDGVQTSRIGISKLEKTIINLLLNEMGIYQSEIGFPFSKSEVNYINANIELSKMGVLEPIVLSGWCRAIVKDVEDSLRYTNIEHLNISISTSDIMIQGKFQGKKTRDDILKMMTEAAEFAKKNGIKTLGVNAEDASRSDMSFLIKFAKEAKNHGADRIRYCDTLGYDDPFTIYERVRTLAEEVKIPIELHCHNDLGMAVANSVAGAKGAIDAGVDAYINTCINGIGERAGNADLVSVILAVKKASSLKDKLELDERVDLSKAWKICKYTSYAFGIPIPINQVGVGANAFAHESGIHVDGTLKNRRNYELYDYEELGRPEQEIVETGRVITVGEYSGMKGFKTVCERLKINLNNEKRTQEIFELVRYANLHTQKPLTEYELRFIVQYPEQARKIMTVIP